MKPEIVRRYSQNPILTKGDIPYPVETVHNAAVVKHNNDGTSTLAGARFEGKKFALELGDSGDGMQAGSSK